MGAGGNTPSSPAVANGVVYIASQGRHQANGRVYAFPAACAVGNTPCAPLWRSAGLGAMVNTSPAIANGTVYVASNSGAFYAFGLRP